MTSATITPQRHVRRHPHPRRHIRFNCSRPAPPALRKASPGHRHPRPASPPPPSPANATPPDNGFDTKFEIVGKPSGEEQQSRINLVSPTYYSVLKIPLLQGRIWDESENHRGALVAVINQTLARRYFPNGDAIGHTLRLPEVKEQPPFFFAAPGYQNGVLIVGVIADKLDDGLAKPIRPEAFVPYTFGRHGHVYADSGPLRDLASRPATTTSASRSTPSDRDQQASGDVRDLEHWITRTPEWARGQLVAWLFGAFAGLALALAAVGLYSVVSYAVVQRTNEFGIRIALRRPAHPRPRHGVFRSMAISVGAGIAAGLILTLALNKVLAAWAAESSRDPLLLFAAAFVLGLVALLACTVPARRAAGLDPMKAIRYGIESAEKHPFLKARGA